MSDERIGDGTMARLPLFEGLFEAAPDAVIAVDDRGLIRVVNRLAEQLFGYRREHWDADEVRLLRLLASQVGPAIEMGYLVDGQQRQSELYTSVLQAQADLGVVVALMRGNEIIYANATFAGLSGREAREKGGLREVLGMVVAEERALVLARWSAAQGSPQRFRMRLRRPDGTIRQLDVALASVTRTEGDEVPSIVAVAHDVTELAAAQERFERIFRTNPSGILLGRLADGIIVDVNERWLELLGLAHDQVVGRTTLALGIFADPAERGHFVEELRAAGRLRDREFALRAADGTRRHALVSAEVVELGGVPHILTTLVDVTERKRAEAELEQLALHDALTGLPNRALFQDRLERTIVAAGRQESSFTVLYLDIDNFKEVNDAFGHEAGDELLRAVGERLRGALREADTVARFGGDEYAMLLPGTRDAGAAVVAARRMLDELGKPFAVADQQVYAQASVGVVLWPQDGSSAADLLRHADVAMYSSKRAGGGYALHALEQDERSEARLSLRADLHKAIERGELFVEYQPMVDLPTGARVRVEALVRWRHPVRGVVPPDEFIPFAEESGFIRPLGLWVLEDALGRWVEWRADGGGPGVSVNLSARNLADPALLGRVAELLARWSVPPGSLTVEITESAVMADPERALSVLRALRDLGVRLSVDDFGTGYSSLSYLQRLPVVEVKVDRSFVGRMIDDPSSAAIVRSTIDLGHSLGLEVIAEGVEDEPTAERLRALGCDVIQGFLIARPMPAPDLAIWLRARGSGSAGR